MKYRILTTRELFEMNDSAIKANYNRVLDEKVLKKIIDPHGTHVVVYDMEHDHKAGIKTEPHVRTIILVKTLGSPIPQHVTLDMSFEDFMSLDVVDVPIPEHADS